jgi:hypothetical protein
MILVKVKKKSQTRKVNIHRRALLFVAFEMAIIQ